jgi:hypothetical protein
MQPPERASVFQNLCKTGADNIKMDLTEMGCVDVDHIHSDHGGRLLCEQDEEPFGSTQGLTRSYYYLLMKESAPWT